MFKYSFINFGAAFALACALGSTQAHAINPADCTKPIKTGMASWYGEEMAKRKKNGKRVFNKTASGEAFSPNALTAAHKTLKLGTYVKAVTQDDKELIVKINDRGPYEKGRIIDFTRHAAELLDFKEDGETKVTLYKCTP